MPFDVVVTHDPRVRTGVATTAGLLAAGISRADVATGLRSRRWQRLGRAVVLHNGRPTDRQWLEIMLINAGRRSAVTSYTALAFGGLRGWRRSAWHVAVPVGTSVRQVPGAQVVVHRVVAWAEVERAPRQPRVHAVAPAAVLAASGEESVRSACGLLAAVVQQRLARPARLMDLVVATPNLRHRAALIAALHDIGMGAEALSEIDFARLCRRAGLLEPVRQAVRVQPDGRRRYLDVEWRRPDGTPLVAEIDGALHLRPENWWDDQFRQNEVVIGRGTVLRFPAVAVRTGDPLVVDQLVRAGVPRRHH
ncbi:hypothetical protein ACXR2U_14525 [Jatrophihabitans sp. YIM 134969]